MFEQALRIYRNKTKVETMGRRSSFNVITEGNKFYIILSSNKPNLIDKDHFDKVLARYNDLKLPEKHQTSQYTDPKWPQRPNRIYSPAVAAVIRDMIENRKVFSK